MMRYARLCLWVLFETKEKDGGVVTRILYHKLSRGSMRLWRAFPQVISAVCPCVTTGNVRLRPCWGDLEGG